MELKCANKECEYEWNYKGKKRYPAWVTCPNCLRKVRFPKEVWKSKNGAIHSHIGEGRGGMMPYVGSEDTK